MAKQGDPFENELDEETEKILSSLPPLNEEELPKQSRPRISAILPPKGQTSEWEVWEAAWNEYLNGRGK